MDRFCYILGLTIFSLLYSETISIPSKLKVYTYFTDQRTWNEASALCQTVQRHLVSIASPSDEVVMNHYFNNDWSNYTDIGPVWTSKHWLKTTDEPIFFDCVLENSTTNAPNGPDDYCTHISSTTGSATRAEVRWDNCNDSRPFVCETIEGYCWFRPYDQADVVANPAFATLDLQDVQADDCAKECQMNVTMAKECWAFTFDNDSSSCELFFTDRPFIDDTGLTLSTTKVLYRKICYKSQLWNESTTPLGIASDLSMYPATTCEAGKLANDLGTEEICYCECDEEPDIREPTEEKLTLAQKIEQIVLTLTVNPKNTSKELRKLSSAYDPRPSCQNIGIVGIVVLTVVFSGIVILDMELVIRGFSYLKDMVSQSSSNASDTTK